MKTVVDTSALIAFLQRKELGNSVADLLESGQAVIPAVCVFELLASVKSSVHRHQRRRLLSLAEIIPMDRDIAEAAADLFTTLRLKGKTIDNEDLMAAATALHLNLPILTTNKVHFNYIPELTVI